MKGNDNWNIHGKFKYIAAIFLIRSKKTYIARLQTPSLPITLTACPTIPEGRAVIFFTKMTGEDDPTISCSRLMAELSILAGRMKTLRGD